MSELDDIDALAGEYVLGTLTSAERQDVDGRRHREKALDANIRAWERRLGPLGETLAPVAPSPELYDKIRARLMLANNVVPFVAREQVLLAKVARWRNAAAGMSAVAAALVGVIGWQGYNVQAVPTQYVAVLQTEDEKPAFLLTVNTVTNVFCISAINAPKQQNKSYQVWLVHDEMPGPKSLGLFHEGEMDVRPMATGKEHDMFMDATFAVSLEPDGGSPTGSPTGPVVFSGKLFKATP